MEFGCGPTALVHYDPTGVIAVVRGVTERASQQRLGPSALAATGAELRPAVDLRGAFGNKVNHAVAGFGLYERLWGGGAWGTGPGG